MRVKTLQELADAGKLSGKRVLIRSDLNAPHDESGRITDETRLTASVPAIQMALKAGAAVMVVSHLGRPKEGVPTEAESLITWLTVSPSSLAPKCPSCATGWMVSRLNRVTL